MAELLLELLSEEIPARMQARAAEDLQRMVTDGLKKNALEFANPRVFVTPRRLALTIEGIPDQGLPYEEERKGPRFDAPDQALGGFFRNFGIDQDRIIAALAERCPDRRSMRHVAEDVVAEALRDAGYDKVTLNVAIGRNRDVDVVFEKDGKKYGVEVKTKMVGKGPTILAYICAEGRPAAEIVKEIIADTLANFPWPKSQRWGANTIRWVRPLHRIVCLFDGAVVPVSFGPISAGNETVGHRFLAPEPFTVRDFAQYLGHLRTAKVMLNQDERREFIQAEAERLARAEGLTVRPDDGLLAEVTGLVEWPVVLLGSIDEQFMDVPAEVLITSMRSHQKYFSLLRDDGSLAPRFVVVANRDTADGGREVVAGNQRVLRARLSDAKFFWDTDRKSPLESRVAKLAERLFYAPLGTIADKAHRTQALAKHLSFFVAKADKGLATRAALLAKADLSSEMVGEFPELQGIMGRYYAINDGEPPAVAEAIADHYAPQGPGDRCPTAPNSVVVALADKLDTLVGFFGIDEKPTGSKDPFALRRAALGVIRLIVENGLRLPLMPLFDFAAAEVHGTVSAIASRSGESFATQRLLRDGWAEDHYRESFELLDFFADRLKVHLRDAGTRHDLVSAVFALGNEDDLVRLLARVTALEGFLGSDDGANLLIAYRRAANIVRIEEKKDGVAYDRAVDASLLQQPEERALADRLAEVGAQVRRALAGEHFPEAMAALARLRQPVDAFFDKVTVNTEHTDVRANRLGLLSAIVAAMQTVADFSKIEG